MGGGDKLRIHKTKDTALAEKILADLRRNDNYCPCKLEHIPENKCPCAEFINGDKLGACHCGLYVKEEL